MSALKRIAAFAMMAASLLWLTGCGGGGGIGGTGSPDTGTLRASITDAPSCGFNAVNVTVQKVRVHKDPAASDSDAGWAEIVLNPPQRVNLLNLTNGVLAELGQTPLPAGQYTQLRLVLLENDNANPLANSVLPTGGAETALDTPSADQSGLKINVDITVEAGKVADVVIDFDACKSIVKRGNSGAYNLKPVIHATQVVVSDAGLRVIGHLHSSIALPGTQVSVESAGVVVKSTVPDSSGRFELYPVPAGTYDLVVESAGHVTAVVTGVPVIASAPTDVNSATTPIAPAVSAVRAVTGKVTPASAGVRALQMLSGGPTVAVATASVDATSGDFAFSLPIAAPVKAAYVASPAVLNFVADAGVAGLYTLEARLDAAVKTQAIDTNAVVAPVNFVFP